MTHGPAAAVLVDDEQLARDELGYLLGQVGGVEVIGQAGNGVEALDDDRAAAARRGVPRRPDAGADRLRGGAPACSRPAAAVADRLRHRLRPARDRGVRGQRGRLPAEAGRSGAARGGGRAGAAPRGVCAIARPSGRRRRQQRRSSRRSSSWSPNGRAAASGWRSRSASGSCSSRPKRSSTPRWPTKASRS